MATAAALSMRPVSLAGQWDPESVIQHGSFLKRRLLFLSKRDDGHEGQDTKRSRGLQVVQKIGLRLKDGGILGPFRLSEARRNNRGLQHQPVNEICVSPRKRLLRSHRGISGPCE